MESAKVFNTIFFRTLLHWVLPGYPQCKSLDNETEETIKLLFFSDLRTNVSLSQGLMGTVVEGTLVTLQLQFPDTQTH